MDTESPQGTLYLNTAEWITARGEKNLAQEADTRCQAVYDRDSAVGRGTQDGEANGTMSVMDQQ